MDEKECPQEPGIIGFIERSYLHDQDKLECPSAPTYTELNKQVDKIREEEKYYMLKDFISKNRDVTKLILKNLEKPVKSIDIPLTKLNLKGFSTIKVYKNFEYNFWIEIHMDFQKDTGLKFAVFKKYVNGFKDLTFTVDNNYFYISFKSKLDILESDVNLKITH